MDELGADWGYRTFWILWEHDDATITYTVHFTINTPTNQPVFQQGLLFGGGRCELRLVTTRGPGPAWGATTTLPGVSELLFSAEKTHPLDQMPAADLNRAKRSINVADFAHWREDAVILGCDWMLE